MIVAEIEQALVDRLAPLREADLWVRSLPDRPGEMGVKPTAGQVLMVWVKSEFGKEESISSLVQSWTMTWLIELQLNDLRSESGGHPICEAVLRLLAGFKPPHCKSFRAKSTEAKGRTEKNQWIFHLIFEAETMLIGESAETIGALLQQILYDGTVNDVAIAEFAAPEEAD